MITKVKTLLLIVFLTVTVAAAQKKKTNNPGIPKVTDVWVVFKTHFDLGFTDLPENVFARYRGEMMDKALSVIEKNATLPKHQHFAWTVPGWPLYAQILGPQQDPERKKRIEKAVREGSIVAHGLAFTTHTESLDYEDLVRGLGYSSRVARTYGLPLPISAKMTDVPGHSWIMPTLLNNAGIRFLQLGCNPASQSPRFPQMFWWEGADGSKVLCQYTSDYGSGIKAPSDWPSRNYLAMIMTGDNHGPPNQKEVEAIVAQINKEMPGVKIHLGTLDDFAKAILAEKPDLPTVKGDTPDSWIHGLLSNPVEAKIGRNIRPLESALDGLNTQMRSWGLSVKTVSDKLEKAYEQSLLYAEHTWGMNAEYGPRYSYGDDWKKWLAEAAAEPDPENGDFSKLKNSNAHNTSAGSKKKWLHSYDVKRQYIHNTNDIINTALSTHLDLLAKSVNVAGKRLVVYNPLPWKRSGIIENPWKKGSYFYAKEIAPSGYVTYTQNEINESIIANDQQAEFNTPNFKIAFDLKRGGISSLVEKRTNRELVDKSSKYVVGQFLHERFSTKEVDQWFNVYSRIKTGWGLNDLGKPGMLGADKAPYMAFTPNDWEISVAHTSTADVATLTAVDTKGLARKYTLVFSFPRNAAYVDVEWFVDDKTPDKQPEGGWLCFPFAVKDPKFTVGRLGGPISPATDLISGSNKYLMAVNSGVSITQNDKSGMGLTPKDSPLISLGEPGLWKFSLDYIPKVPSVFVNIYNNMWNTNFPLWQEGSWSERVGIWPIDKNTETVANLTEKSWEARLPLLTGVSDGDAGHFPAKNEGISISGKGVLVTAFGEDPDGNKGTLLRLWEQAGNSGVVSITLPGKKFHKAIPVNLRGEVRGKPINILNGKFSCSIKQFAPASFILE
jgi:alpha-mannosidase